MLDWAIYYDDGRVYTDEDGRPAYAPKRGVQAIARRSERVGVAYLEGHDYYWRDDGSWFGGDRFGLFDYLARPGEKVVLFGRSMTDAEYESFMQRVKSDDFPQKSAWERYERRP